MLPLSDTKTSTKPPLQTIFVLLALVSVFIVELSTPDLDSFIRQYSLIPILIQFNDLTSLFPFVTAIFLHNGLVHLLSNSWFLWIFGDNVESRFGIWFIPLFILGGITGNLAQYIINPTSEFPVLGVSGAVAAILGAYITLFPRNKIKTLVPFLGFVTVINISASIMLFYWFFIQLFNGTGAIVTDANTFRGVAWFAHIGGFLSGSILAFFLRQISPHPR